MSTFELDEDSALVALEEGRWQGKLSARWNIGNVPNGGYSMSVAAKAMAQSMGWPHPLSVTAYYLEPLAPGAIEVHVEPVRQGRSSATAMARLAQAGRERIRLLGTFCNLADSQGITRLIESPLQLAPLDQCDGIPPSFPGPPILQRFDFRIPKETPGFWRDKPGGAARVAGWIRFRDGRPVDPISLLLIADAFFPAVFNHFGPLGWVPTLELTVFLRGIPVPGWLACQFRTRYITAGYLEEDGEIWDEAGNLVAMCRQLARMPRGG